MMSDQSSAFEVSARDVTTPTDRIRTMFREFKLQLWWHMNSGGW